MIRNPFSLLFALLSLFSSSTALAQGGPRGPREGGPPPKIGIITGTVVEDSVRRPVPFASVAALRMPDSSMVGGTLTDDKGRFKLEELPPGNYTLRISSIGFKTALVAVGRINPENIHLVAGTISLKSSANRLKEVKIEADEPEYINSIDKKVYSVDKNIVNTGGTVTDVLQQIPSVSVDIDGKVALRGSENVTILVDGKPSGMLGNDRRAVLQQIPASAVDQIEVITNPSAKYDAEGMAGIINIKTKKDKFQGTNGNVSAGVGTNDKYNLSFSGNDRNTKRNLFANYTYRHESRYSYGSGDQHNYLPGFPEYDWSSNSNNESSNNSQNIRAGVDFYLTPENTLSVSGGTSLRSDSRPDNVNYQFYYPDNDSVFNYFKNTVSANRNVNLDGNLDFKHQFLKNKGELTSSVSYSNNDRHEEASYISSLVNYDEIPYQESTNEGLFQSLVIQADLSWPFKKVGKLESGVKSSLRQIDNDQDVSNYDPITNGYTNDAYLSNTFSYDEQILAAYSMFSGRWNKFEYNGGLRAEQTLLNVYSAQSDSTVKNDYLNLFPSAFLKYNLAEKQEVQVSYSRRINRPDGRQLDPFKDISDTINVRQGNPYLKPETTHSLEASYGYTFGGNSITTSLYYRHTDDLISRYRSVDSTTGIATMTSVNFSSSENIGFEAVMRVSFARQWNAMASFNIFQNTIDAENISAELQSENTNWNARLNINGKIISSLSIQITANYVSVMKNPVGQVKGMSGVDAGLRQDLLKGKGTLSLNVTDIFKTRLMRIYNYGEFYDYYGQRYRESRVGMLTFSYRFGKMDNTQRRRSKSNDQQRMGGESMDSIDF